MVQVIKYKCCDKVFAACIEPECYTEKTWLKELRKYVLRGDKVEVVDNASIDWGKCECKTKEPDLFSEQGLIKIKEV